MSSVVIKKNGQIVHEDNEINKKEIKYFLNTPVVFEDGLTLKTLFKLFKKYRLTQNYLSLQLFMDMNYHLLKIDTTLFTHKDLEYISIYQDYDFKNTNNINLNSFLLKDKFVEIVFCEFPNKRHEFIHTKFTLEVEQYIDLEVRIEFFEINFNDVNLIIENRLTLNQLLANFDQVL